MNVNKVHSVNVDKVVISEQKGSKAKISYIGDDDELFKFKIQTGSMRIPWDAKERKNPSGKVVSINLSASTFEMFDDDNKNNVRLFRELIYKIEELYEPFISDLKLSSSMYSNNPKFSPVAQLSIPIKDGQPDVTVFNKSGARIDFSNVKKGAICEFIIRVSHFWTSAKSYGLQLVAEQIRVVSESKIPSNNFSLAITSDSDSDSD